MLDRGLDHAQTLLFRALADETRIQLLDALMEHERNVTDLVATVGKEQSAVSHHLRCLRTCGLVRTRKAGKEIFYTLNGGGRIRALLELARSHVQETLTTVLSCDVVGGEAPNVTITARTPARIP